MSRLATCALLASFMAWFMARPVGAAELSVARRSPCTSASELSFRVERALGQPLSSTASLRCTVHVVHEQGALAARLELERPGQFSRLQSFRAASCPKLNDTLTLAIVLAIGATSSAERLPQAPTSSSLALGDVSGALVEPPARAFERPVEPPARARDPAAAVDSGARSARLGGAHPGPRLGAQAALVADVGTLPSPSIGASLGASLGGSRLALRALGTYLPAREVSSRASSAEMGLLAGAVLGCAPRLLRGPRLELGACVGGELGRLSIDELGADGTGARRALWSAARVELGGRCSLGPPGLAVDLLLSGLVPVAGRELAVSDPVTHAPAGVALRASLGLSLELD